MRDIKTQSGVTLRVTADGEGNCSITCGKHFLLVTPQPLDSEYEAYIEETGKELVALKEDLIKAGTTNNAQPFSHYIHEDTLMCLTDRVQTYIEEYLEDVQTGNDVTDKLTQIKTWFTEG